jgi:anaerobic selenocysteine-containing dehydrogenase
MAEKIEWIKTHCSRMDHGGCGILVGVRNGRIVEIKGDADGFLNQGYICAKGRNAHEKLYHANRLESPLRRIGARGDGQWKPVSWEEALDVICENLSRIRQAHGAKSVAFCQGMPKGMEHFALIRLAHTFGSPNIVAVQDVCHAPREVSGLHTCGFYPVTDYHHPSQVILLWGSNPPDTNEEGEISSLLMKQLREGAELIVVDPRRTLMAEKAAYWLQIRPGTDAALALAFLHVIIEEKLYDQAFVQEWTNGFDLLQSRCKAYAPEVVADICGIVPGLIRESARCYAKGRPAAIGWGNAIEQHMTAWDTTRALICLMAVCGNLDVPGGNIHALDPSLLGLAQFVRADLVPEKIKEMIHAHFGTVPRLMTVPAAYFRRAVLDEVPYPVKAAYMQCTNPLMGYADTNLTSQALSKLDFLAVSDVFMTPTAAMADIVLPAATQFEFNDIGHYGLGHGIVLARKKIVDPPHRCWPDVRIINELGKRLSRPEYWFDDEDAMMEAVLKPSGLTFDAFCRKGYLKGAEMFRKYAATGFKTASKKVELNLGIAAKWGLSQLPEFLDKPLDPAYPLILTSAKSPNYLHSAYRWMDSLRRKESAPTCQIHPQTAQKAGISDGDDVKIETFYGQMVQTAHITDRIRSEVIIAAYGWWFPEEDSAQAESWKRSNYNMLTHVQELGKAFGTPTLKGIPCRIQIASRS